MEDKQTLKAKTSLILVNSVPAHFQRYKASLKAFKENFLDLSDMFSACVWCEYFCW